MNQGQKPMLENKRPAFGIHWLTYLPVVLYFILPNIFPFLLSRALGGVPHGYINLECLFIGAVGLFLPRGALLAILGLESLLDFAYGICYTYKFSLAEFASSMRYMAVLPRERVIEGMIALALSAGACMVLGTIRTHRCRRFRTAILLTICALIPAGIDVFNGQNLLWHKDATLASYRLVRSPALVIGLWEVSAYRVRAQTMNEDDRAVDSASAHALSHLDGKAATAESPNIVLVLVESWGMMKDSHLAQLLVTGYDDPRIASRYTVLRGAVPFTGLTVPGESRELCHLSAGFGIMNAPAELAKQCLPAHFHDRGYQNIAIHGYTGQMFSRDNWYPKLGFDQMWFEPELTHAGLPSCDGAFPGICDASIGGWIGSSLLSGQEARPRFIYWVTLNSHIPVPARLDLPEDGTCASEPALANSPPLCSWFRLVRNVHESAEKIAMQSNARPTIFVVVGDHAPPFSKPERRNAFSGAEVPYLILIPKAIQRR